MEYTECQNYALFGDVVIHGRISDYPGYYPTIGNNIQEDIDYNKKLEQQRKEKKWKRFELYYYLYRWN